MHSIDCVIDLSVPSLQLLMMWNLMKIEGSIQWIHARLLSGTAIDNMEFAYDNGYEDDMRNLAAWL